jgi:hypothetical protein
MALALMGQSSPLRAKDIAGGDLKMTVTRPTSGCEFLIFWYTIFQVSGHVRARNWPGRTNRAAGDSGGAPLTARISIPPVLRPCDPSVLDEDPAVGLAARLGLVSDALAFICNECTAAMIDARLAARSGAARRDSGRRRVADRQSSRRPYHTVMFTPFVDDELLVPEAGVEPTADDAAESVPPP